jgi:hypothetical protein
MIGPDVLQVFAHLIDERTEIHGHRWTCGSGEEIGERREDAVDPVEAQQRELDLARAGIVCGRNVPRLHRP